MAADSMGNFDGVLSVDASALTTTGVQRGTFAFDFRANVDAELDMSAVTWAPTAMTISFWLWVDSAYVDGPSPHRSRSSQLTSCPSAQLGRRWRHEHRLVRRLVRLQRDDDGRH